MIIINNYSSDNKDTFLKNDLLTSFLINSNINNISHLFYECNSLLNLPDISKWNTSNVTDMSNIFYGCSSLKSLPDISKWNISKVQNMSYMFY